MFRRVSMAACARREARMRIERELMRGAGPAAVLRLLRDGEMYGYELVEALDKRTGGVLDMGQSTLYPMLYNLEAQGLIEGRWKTASAGEGGRERKYYRLTGKGRERLKSDTKQLESLAVALVKLGLIGAGGAGEAGGGAAVIA